MRSFPLPPATVLTVAAVMGTLYGVDKWLANLEAREVRSEAFRLYKHGLMEAGIREPAAADDFRRALSLDRTNRDFELALAGAQLTEGKPLDAQETLADPLERNSNDGRANFLMARVRVAQGRFDDAVSFYHRAIYGLWPDGGEADRTEARLELAKQLARRNRNEELLSELLLLEDPAKKNVALRREVAGLYLRAGSPNRAEMAYQELVHADLKDADAWDGLGQAELKLGQYRNAHVAFSTALRYRANDPKAAAKVELADRLARLDPTLRRLGSKEKFRRSQEILDLAEDSIQGCLKGKAAPEEMRDLLAASAKLKSEQIKGSPSNEAAEGRLELAEQLWNARLKLCGNVAPGDGPLPIIIGKIAQ